MGQNVKGFHVVKSTDAITEPGTNNFSSCFVFFSHLSTGYNSNFTGRRAEAPLQKESAELVSEKWICFFLFFFLHISCRLLRENKATLVWATCFGGATGL